MPIRILPANRTPDGDDAKDEQPDHVDAAQEEVVSPPEDDEDWWLPTGKEVSGPDAASRQRAGEEPPRHG